MDILVVDDTAANLVALEAVLVQPEATVVCATSGAEALALVEAHDYAVVILDVQMPELDGFEVARRIRATDGRRSTPIIFLTAYGADPPDVRRAYAIGAVDFVIKPFDPEILRSKVSVFMDLFRKSRELIAQGERLQAAQAAVQASAVADARREWEAAATRARIERERDEACARATELKRMDHLKDQFLATLAHELRNPITSLLVVADLLEQRPVEDEALARRHALVRRLVDHLRRLVEDSLEISRFTEGKIELRSETIDLREVVERAVELSHAVIHARAIHLAVSLPPTPLHIAGDPVRLAQVVSNLLDNAAKFTPEGGRVSIGLEATALEATVRVRDSGRGIPPDHLSRIFEPFVQSRAADSSRGGLGIGLALVKRLTELHGGRVSAASGGNGRGAELTVTLPLGRRARAAPRAASAAGRPPAGASPSSAPEPVVRVLVVDDNPEIRSTVQVFLQLEGHSVATAESGSEALDQIAATDPDVVLLDIELPDIDGYAVARQVRAVRRDRRPRLVAITGNAGSGERDRALRAGFDAQVTKPIDGRTLMRLIVDG